MKKSAFLHCGMPKTGTTTIQNFLHNHRDVLKEQGILYPKSNYIYRNHREYLFAIQKEGKIKTRLELDISKDEEVKNFSLNQWKNMQKDFIEGDFSRLLLSFEDFLYKETNFQILKNYLSKINIRTLNAIVYVREPISNFHSQFVQNLKVGRNPIRVVNRGNKFKKQVPLFKNLDKNCESNLIVRPHESSQYVNGDLLEDFLFHSDLPSENFTKSRENANVNKLSSEAIAVLWNNNLRYQNKPINYNQVIYQRDFLKKLKRADTKLVNGTKFNIHPIVADYILHAGSEYVSFLSEGYGLRFSNIDYSQLGKQSEKPEMHYPEDVFNFSRDRFSELSAMLSADSD